METKPSLGVSETLGSSSSQQNQLYDLLYAHNISEAAGVSAPFTEGKLRLESGLTWSGSNKQQS